MNSPGEVDPAPEEKISAEIETNAEVEAAETEGESGAQTLKSEERETEVNSSGNDSQHIPTERSDPADISNSSSEEQNIDPATGECNSVAMDTEESSVVAEESNETTALHSTFTNYAAIGPQSDQNGVTKQLEAILLDESNTPGSVREGEGKERDDSEPVSLPDESDIVVDAPRPVAALKTLQVQDDSLEGSLKRFCTPELLTGSNKFACAVCTKDRAEQSMPLQWQEGEEGEEEEEENQEQGKGGEKREKEDEKEKSETKIEGDQASVTAENEEDTELQQPVQNENVIELKSPSDAVSQEIDGDDELSGDKAVSVPSPVAQEEPVEVKELSGNVAVPSPSSEPNTGNEEENELSILEESEGKCLTV